MNKDKYIECPQCEYQFLVNAWGVPKSTVSRHGGAIDRARKKLEKEIGFGIKPKK